MSDVKERPILFSGPMVRAILDGRKTQTRRLVDLSRAVGEPSAPEGCVLDLWYPGARAHYGYAPGEPMRSEWQVQRLCTDACAHTDDVGPYDGRHPVAWGPLPFWPGLHLWVRETWCQQADMVHGHLIPGKAHYAADGYEVRHVDGPGRSPWRPSIHMPRWASRITLEVVSVRAERLHDITEEDARAEGVADGLIPADEDGPVRIGYVLGDEDGRCVLHATPVSAFASGWDSINGHRPGASWKSKPWVWRVEFRRMG